MKNQEEFDQWYSESDGDPWGYGNDFVVDRIRRSAEFVKKNLSSADIFVELGAFNGDFTLQLKRLYPKVEIFVNDISQVALDQAKKKLEGVENLHFRLGSMSEIEGSDYPVDQPVVTILESLYYVNHDQRFSTLKRIVETLQPNELFISGPISDPKYFNEKELTTYFNRLGYELVALEALNLKKVIPMYRFFLSLMKFKIFRSKFAHQVIYYFKKNDNSN